ncbi:NPD-domain-containing protein [Ascodesmis nigricans]|uniref:NPD-domain-containing protein n=1 Tax=Ascodesmis nigricans TaxID=341454 RepID=A0A4S2N0N8_9PEZI|nr:NPD-domain-containing protein [Ascodesmis nigricans]
MSGPITTDFTRMFNIQHPISLAGMNVAAGPKLAAAVTNAGGIGVIGGVGYTPAMLKDQIAELKSYLNDKKAPFGVDLLLPKVGEGARATNYDYTKGKLGELVDIVIAEGAKLFVSAVGVPPKWVVDKLHANGIAYMNMIGHPKHVKKCIEIGADIICAQGGEGGGHTGDVPTSILIPSVVELVKNHKSPLTGQPVQVLAAGGIYNGKSLAAALMLGASGVWVGTRFILADEAGAPKAHQEAVRTAGFDDTIRTIIFTVCFPEPPWTEYIFNLSQGRPLRVRNNAYISSWENDRKDEIKQLTSKGIIPVEYDIEKLDKEDKLDDDTMDNARPFLMGKVAAVVNDKKPAKVIVDEMVAEAVEQLRRGAQLLGKGPRL